MNNGEYSTQQKQRICNHILEFYKDGKYMYDPDAKKQTGSHYTKKSEIMKQIDQWVRQDSIIRYIVPILDYNLETDYEALEAEWDKTHRIAIKLEDTQNKYKHLEQCWDIEVKNEVKKRMKEWVSEKEDISKLYCEMEEAENRHKERQRRHMTSMANADRREAQLREALKKIENETRDKRVKEIETELNEKEAKPGLQKQLKRLEKINNKLEKDLLTKEKKKMDVDLKYLSLKKDYEEMKAELGVKCQQLETQIQYFKLKEQVQAQVQVPEQEQEQEEELSESEESD
jgi:hypothetical protein